MSTATALQRRFRFGVTTLADPDPSLLPLDALRLHSRAYAFLSSATLGEPIVEGDLLVYPVQKPAVQTKGAGKKPAAAKKATLNDIVKWGQETSAQDDSQPLRWQEVSSLVSDRATSRTNAVIDSFLLPMA